MERVMEGGRDLQLDLGVDVNELLVAGGRVGDIELQRSRTTAQLASKTPTQD